MELKQAPSGPTTKKNLGAPGPPTGEIWGVKVSNFSPSPSNSLRQISEIFRPLAGLETGYNARDFGKSAGNAAGDIVDFELAPGPRVCIVAQTYKTESFILLDTPPQRGRSRRGQRRDPQYGPPFFPQRAHVPRPEIYPWPLYRRFFELRGAKNAKPEVVWSRDLLDNGTNR